MRPILFKNNAVLFGNDQIIIEINQDSEYFLCEKHVINMCFVKEMYCSEYISSQGYELIF